MHLFNYRVMAVVLLCLVGTGPVWAQPPRPIGPTATGGPPVFSPYLNMLRDTSPAAINYFGLVRPQIMAEARFGALQQQIAATQQQLGTSANGEELPTTGQPAYFLTTGGYFLNNQVGGNVSGIRLPGASLPVGQRYRPNLPYRR